MLVQYTAASLVSECKTLAHPASVDSIGSSAGQEDHVSMGMTAARHAREVVSNAEVVIALEALVAARRWTSARRSSRPRRRVPLEMRSARASRSSTPTASSAGHRGAVTELVRTGALLESVEGALGALD